METFDQQTFISSFR